MRPELLKNPRYTNIKIRRIAHTKLKLAATAKGISLMELLDEFAEQASKEFEQQLSYANSLCAAAHDAPPLHTAS